MTTRQPAAEAVVGGIGMTEPVHAVRSALGRSTLRRALLAYLAFTVAEWAVWIALLIWAYDRGGVAGASLMSIVQLLPAVVVAPLAATVGDRMHRGRALAVGYALQGVTMLMTAGALALDSRFVVVAGCGALVTAAVTLTRPVHNAVVPLLAQSPAELLAGNAAGSTVEALGAFLGPLACGLVIVAGGPESVFTGFGLLLLAAAGVVVTLPVARSAPVEPSRGQLLAGFRELRARPAAAVLVTMVAGQYVVLGALDVLLIVVALDVLHLDPSGPGLLGSALGIGGVLGALGSVLLVGRRRLSPALAVGLMVSGLPLMLLPLGTIAFGAGLLLVISGAGRSFFDVAGRTLLQRSVPDEVLARVFGVQESVMTAALAVGAALAPAGVHSLGRSGALVATGALLPVAGLAGSRWLRRLDQSAVQPGPWLGLLRTVPSLRLAPPAVLESLSRAATEMEASEDAVVVAQGARGDAFYIVAEGELKVLIDGTEVRRLRAGDSFGEIALLQDVERTATVMAMGPVRLVIVHREDFLRAVLSSPTSRQAADTVVRDYLSSDAARDGDVAQDS